MPDFNPSNALMRFAWESLVGIAPPDGAAWHDHKFVSETLSPEFERIDLESINPNSQRSVGLPSKIATDGDVVVETDAEGHARYFASLQKFSRNPVDLGGGAVWRHRLAPSETDVEFGTHAVAISRDDGSPAIFSGGRVRQAQFTLSPRGVLRTTFGQVFERLSYWGDPVEAVQGATPATEPLRVRGLPNYAIRTGANDELWAEVDSIAGLPDTIDLKFDMSTGATAPASFGGGGSDVVSTIPVGLDADGNTQWGTVFSYADGSRIGDRSLEVEAFIQDSTGFEVGDRWRFDREGGVWVPSLPDVPVFNEIFAFILIGGDVYRIRQFDLTILRPVEAVYAIGRRFPWEVRERGFREVSGTLQREYLDRNLRLRLENGEPFSVKLEAYSGNIIAAGIEEQLFLTMPTCIAGGRGASVGGQATLDESIAFTAHPDPTEPGGYVDDATIEIVSSEASLAA